MWHVATMGVGLGCTEVRGTGRATVLVVDDDDSVARLIARGMPSLAATQTLRSAAEAQRALFDRSRPQQWVGLVFSVALRDGSGLDLLLDARAIYPAVPALIVANELSVDRVNTASRLRAHLVAKPFEEADLAYFLDQVARASPSTLCQSLAAQWALTVRESELLSAAFRGESRQEVQARMGITANTYKTHARNVLQKSGYNSLKELVLEALRRP